MENSEFIEKRAFPRFPVNIQLRYLDAGLDKIIRTQTFDISAQGLCMIADKELPPGFSLDIFLQMIDDGEKIYRKGKVVWANVIGSEKYRVGIKLEEPRLEPIPLVLRTIMSQKGY